MIGLLDPRADNWEKKGPKTVQEYNWARQSSDPKNVVAETWQSNHPATIFLFIKIKRAIS